MSENRTNFAKLTMSEEEIRIQKEFHNELLEQGVMNVKSNGLSLDELEVIVQNDFGARYVELKDREIRGFKMEVLMNYVVEKPILKNQSESLKNDFERMQSQAKNLIEEYPFDFKVYEFDSIDTYDNHPRMIIEHNNSYLTMRDGNRKLWDEIIVRYGVYDVDIRDKTDRFIGYLYAEYRINHEEEFY